MAANTEMSGSAAGRRTGKTYPPCRWETLSPRKQT